MVDGKTVISLIHFEEGCACEPAVGRILHEPATHKAWALIWVGERYDAIFRHKRRHPNFDAPGGGNGRLQFEHGQFFRATSHPTLDAGRNELAIGAALDIEGFPVLGREPHRSGDVFDGDNSGRRLKPTGTPYAGQMGMRGPLRVVEISGDAYG